MRPLPLGLRTRLKRVNWLYDVVRQRRAQRQEEEYVRLRELYYRKASALFAEPGWKVRARDVLQHRLPGPQRVKPSLSDIRVFAAASDDLGGPRLVTSLAECCETEVFDLRQYRNMDGQAVAESTMAEVQNWRPRLQRDLLRAFKSAHTRSPFDVMFAYGSSFEFEPETLKAIASMGVPIAVLCLDEKHMFLPKKWPWPNGQKPLVGAVDVHLTNSPSIMHWYIGEGSSAYFMPQGVNPQIFHPVDVEKTVDVCFIGQRYGIRGRLMDALRKADVQVACFGAGWGTRTLSDTEMVEMYSRARINIGVGSTGVSERMTCIKGRDVEVTACGGLYLTTYNPELAFLYDIGKEILCYLNEIDCVETVRYYLERPEEAQAIAMAGRARCLREHTWEVRFREFFQWLGILATHATERITGVA